MIDLNELKNKIMNIYRTFKIGSYWDLVSTILDAAQDLPKLNPYGMLAKWQDGSCTWCECHYDRRTKFCPNCGAVMAEYDDLTSEGSEDNKGM